MKEFLEADSNIQTVICVTVPNCLCLHCTHQHSDLLGGKTFNICAVKTVKL